MSDRNSIWPKMVLYIGSFFLNASTPMLICFDVNYDVKKEIKSFIKKIKHNDTLIIENNTNDIAKVFITYKATFDNDCPNNTLEIPANSRTLIPKNELPIEDISLNRLTDLGARKDSFLIPKFADNQIQFSVEEKLDTAFLHRNFLDFTFRSSILTEADCLTSHQKTAMESFNCSCNYFEYIARTEGINIKDIETQRRCLYEKNNLAVKIKKNPKILESASLKIPLLTHKIWLTSDDNPKNPAKEYVQWLKNSISHNSQLDGWRHTFWIESRAKLPEFSKYLDSFPEICLREIDSLDTTKFITGDLYKKAIKQKKFGKASDIIRLEILYEFGGYYLDTDYELFQSLIPYSKVYDLVVGLEPMSVYLCNAFIGVRPKHPVIKRFLELIKRNLSTNAPEYVANIPNDDGFKTIVETGPAMLTLAFAQAGGSGENIDIVMPPQILYPAIKNVYPIKDIVLPTSPIPAQSIGAHYWQTAWMSEVFESRG